MAGAAIQAQMIGGLTRLLSPGGRHGAHQTLLFHRVLPAADPLLADDPDARAFESLLDFLQHHFSIIPLGEAIERSAAGTLPRASLSITFDDGYADNVEVALPVLQRLGLPATFFIATDYLDGGRMWNDTVIETVRRLPLGRHDFTALGLGEHALVSDEQRPALVTALISGIKYLPDEQRLHVTRVLGEQVSGLPDDLMMTTAQLRALRDAGMEIGGHTASHPILTSLEPEQAREDIARGKAVLEGLLGESLSLFAYPNGRRGQDYDASHAAMVRELGFSAAMSTNPGVMTRDADRWQLPRFTPWDRSHGRFALRLLRNRYGML